MASLFFSIVTILAAVVSAVCQTPSARTWPTSVDRWPSIVQVEIRHPYIGWAHSCSASILRSNFVLSAAQCFCGGLYISENRRIRAGATYSLSGGTIHYVARAYNHPSYGANDMNGDITVVRLIFPLIYSPVIQQGQFIAQGIEVPDNLEVWNVGWSYNVVSTFLPRLMETKLQTVNNGVCAAGYITNNIPMSITENMICSRLIINEGAFCQGDPGSPLYYIDPGQGDIIVGILSFSRECTNGTLPSVHTALSPYINWIVATAV